MTAAAMERRLIDLSADYKAARNDVQRTVVRAEYRAMHARWMEAKR
jgi:hypothetical protein